MIVAKRGLEVLGCGQQTLSCGGWGTGLIASGFGLIAKLGPRAVSKGRRGSFWGGRRDLSQAFSSGVVGHARFSADLGRTQTYGVLSRAPTPCKKGIF